MDWRDLIHQFLSVCAEDEHDRLLQAPDCRRSRFIQDFGATSLQSWETERMRANLQNAEASLGSPDDYRVAEASPGLLVVEVDPAPNGHPHCLTRFRLTRQEGQWKLVEYLWKCTCTDGNCGWCDGTGICSVCNGNGKCNFCDGDAICQLCKGARVCRICNGSKMPGWNSMTG